MGNKEVLGKNIRDYRQLRNMTQAQLAEAIGVAPSTISMYETGVREPDMDTIEAIADIFNIRKRDLVPEKADALNSADENTVTFSPERKELISIARNIPEQNVHLMLEVMRSILRNVGK